MEKEDSEEDIDEYGLPKAVRDRMELSKAMFKAAVGFVDKKEKKQSPSTIRAKKPIKSRRIKL